MKQIYAILGVTILLFAYIGGSKEYRSCSTKFCSATKAGHRCCRVGVRMGKRGYDCTVDTIIATQRHKLSFQQKSHSWKPWQKKPSIFSKVIKCKPFEACLECCCKRRRMRILYPPIGG